MRYRAIAILSFLLLTFVPGVHAQDESPTPDASPTVAPSATHTPIPTPLFGRPQTPTPVPVLPTPEISPTPEEPERPPPHLGYGINVGPHSRAPAEMVYGLNVDWIKLYDVPQLDDYPGLRVLYRLDIRPSNDIERFRQEVMHRTQEAVSRGVDAIEVGNEPNLIIEWPPRPNPEEFARFLCITYDAIKAVAPHVIVVSGGLGPAPNLPDGSTINDIDFAQRMFAAGAGNCFDAFGYHPYGFNLPPEADPYVYEYGFRRTERMRELLVRHGLRDKQIWITEFGWLRTPREEGINCDGQLGFEGFEWIQFPSETAADYTARALAFADDNWPWVGPMFLWNLDWHTYDEDFLPLCNQMRWFGILDHYGNPTAVYRRFAAAPRRFSDYQPILSTGAEDMTEVVEAYCPTEVHIGQFKVLNEGYPVSFEALVEPVVGPGIPLTRVSKNVARSGDAIDVYVNTGDVEPGLHLVVVNVVMFRSGRRMSTNVRGWVLAQPPTSPACVDNAPGSGVGF